MKKSTLALCALLAFAITLGYPLVADAVCNTYPGHALQYYPGYGGYCGGIGGGCTECVDDNYNHCVTDGSFCRPGPDQDM